MILRLNKRILKIIFSIVFLVANIIFLAQPGLASDGRSKSIAMQIAEQETNAKAVRAKYKEAAGNSGFRVRLMKDGKVIHKFVSMKRIKKK